MTAFMAGNQPCLTVRKETFVTVQTRKCRLSVSHALLVFSALQLLLYMGERSKRKKLYISAYSAAHCCVVQSRQLLWNYLKAVISSFNPKHAVNRKDSIDADLSDIKLAGNLSSCHAADFRFVDAFAL